MPIERLDPSQIAGLNDHDVRRFIESDFKVRQGLCPNDCGLLIPYSEGQECPSCGYFTNKLPEPEGRAH